LAAQRVVIIGGGVGGLAAALALKDSGHEAVIIERDAEPPSIAPEKAFEVWSRPGVPQFRHAHILLARLQTTLRDRHPELLGELLAAGLELSTVEQVLPASQYTGIEPMPDDGDLLHLWGRRPTFEYVLRRHVGGLPHVRFIHSAKVVGLVTETSGQQLHVRGVELMRGDNRETIAADVVVDASGKRTKAPEWLQAKGVRIEVDSNPSGFVYSCRHYRLKDPSAAPPRQDGGGNLDYLGYATFYAEHGNYALTFGCPLDDTELVDAIRRPDGFEALCDQLPVLKHWTGESEATSKVLGAGQFENRWTRYRVAGGVELLDFFAVGDSQVETNPMYGRGCAAAFVQAEVFGETMRTHADAKDRARHYYKRCRFLLQPYYNLSIATDRMYHTRAKLKRGLPISLRERLLNYAYEAVWLPATHASPLMAREFLKSMQMREVSGPAIQLQVLFQLLRSWIRSWFHRHDATSAPAVPPRTEFMRKLSATFRAPD
jgi:2-polyprenyl-6-methoxyphenol hydroxylase-like FAD-dependent oxidoreductase